MGSQFVDFNGDGHVDYLTATFDGSPHVAYGSAAGFGKPEHLLDAGGERIILSYIWNYETRKHEVLGRAMGTDHPREERCISALAYDWDADGDYDLLLGSYEYGHLYLQKNDGSNAEPRFTGRNLPVMAGNRPFSIDARMTAPRLVDWDGDGDLDIVAGSFGDSYGQGEGGGVYLSLNEGRPGEPAFGPLQTLIEPSRKGHSAPTRPDAGLYADPVDYDGDGDLDLIVGGYSMWLPEARKLTDEEQAVAEKLQQKLDEVRAAQAALNKKVMAEVEAATAGLERGGAEWSEKYSAIAGKYSKDRSALSDRQRRLAAELAELVPSPQRRSFVWLYERK